MGNGRGAGVEALAWLPRRAAAGASPSPPPSPPFLLGQPRLPLSQPCLPRLLANYTKDIRYLAFGKSESINERAWMLTAMERIHWHCISDVPAQTVQLKIVTVMREQWGRMDGRE